MNQIKRDGMKQIKREAAQKILSQGGNVSQQQQPGPVEPIQIMKDQSEKESFGMHPTDRISGAIAQLAMAPQFCGF